MYFLQRENETLTGYLRRIAVLSIVVSYSMFGWTVYVYPPTWEHFFKPLPPPVAPLAARPLPPQPVTLPVPERLAPVKAAATKESLQSKDPEITELRMYDLALTPTPDGELFKTAKLLVNGFVYTVVEGGTIRVLGERKLKVISLGKNEVRILFLGEPEIWRRDGIFWDNIEQGKFDSLRLKTGAGRPDLPNSS